MLRRPTRAVFVEPLASDTAKYRALMGSTKQPHISKSCFRFILASFLSKLCDRWKHEVIMNPMPHLNNGCIVTLEHEPELPKQTTFRLYTAWFRTGSSCIVSIKVSYDRDSGLAAFSPESAAIVWLRPKNIAVKGRRRIWVRSDVSLTGTRRLHWKVSTCMSCDTC
jgi:hypothetical protein